MDTALERRFVARRPSSAQAKPRFRLVCLSRPRFESPGAPVALDPWLETDPARVLLRVVAAGPEGAPIERLRSALWPAKSERAGRRRLNDCCRCLALLLGNETSPISLKDGVAAVDESVLEVDSLVLERRLAPLLEAFREPLPAEVRDAREHLGRAIAADCVFLPGYDHAWAETARRRIADALARAARRLASMPEPKQPIEEGDRDENH